MSQLVTARDGKCRGNMIMGIGGLRATIRAVFTLIVNSHLS